MTDSTSVARAGLMARDTARTPVPLTGVHIDAGILGLCARVTITQRYANRETVPIEAVYVFPLDEGAAVCGFEAVVDGTLVVGEVTEREKAFARYDDAMAQGHGAFLLDEERPDVFQASIGNLLPGTEVLVKLAYVVELAPDAAGVRFAIPTTVSPRYAPAVDRTGVGRPDAETLNPPVGWHVPYGLTLSAAIGMPERITRIESPSHPVSVTLDDRHATVTLSQRDAAMDRDFVLLVETTAFATPHAWVEEGGDGESAIAIALVPRLPATTQARDVVFLVDRSGSMQGTSIAEVRNALQLCLRSMTPGCRFNIVSFGSTYETLFPRSRPYDDESLAKASELVGHMDASLGGTEILLPLKFVLEAPLDEECSREVVVLTDGEVTNTDAVLQLAASHAATTRVFTFGIGAGASHHLVRGLARAGRGCAEFIYPGERVEPKVMRQFSRLLSPALRDVQVSWGDLAVTQAPGVLPPLFSGDRLVVYGFARGARTTNVRLTGTSGSVPFAYDVTIDPAAAAKGRTVATLAARARIRELEEGPEWLAARGSRQRDRKDSRVTAEIIALSTKYGVISRETSFVAVERRETPVVGDVQLRRIPVALTTGWGGVGHQMVLGASQLSTMDVGSIDAPRFAASAPRRSMFRRLLESTTPGQDVRVLSGSRRQPPLARRMLELIALQRADGSWELDERLATVLGQPLSTLEDQLRGARSADPDARRAWATALAVAWLENQAAEYEVEWTMLARKGLQLLDLLDVATRSGRPSIEAARAFYATVA